MQGTENRIAALEKANPPTDDITIFLKFVSPGHLDDEVFRIKTIEGQRWERLPGETQQELIDRASREVKRNEWHAATIMSDD